MPEQPQQPPLTGKQMSLKLQREKDAARKREAEERRKLQQQQQQQQ
jgi:hypothetical protein